MPAQVQNLVLEQGTTFSVNVALTDANNNPLDVSDYTAQSTMRRDYMSQNSIPITATLTTGILNLSMTANNSANVAPGRYVYDAVVFDTNGVVTRVIEGLINVTPEVTNWANTNP